MAISEDEKVCWLQSLEILVWLEECAGSQGDGDSYDKGDWYSVLH